MHQQSSDSEDEKPAKAIPVAFVRNSVTIPKRKRIKRVKSSKLKTLSSNLNANDTSPTAKEEVPKSHLPSSNPNTQVVAISPKKVTHKSSTLCLNPNENIANVATAKKEKTVPKSSPLSSNDAQTATGKEIAVPKLPILLNSNNQVAKDTEEKEQALKLSPASLNPNQFHQAAAEEEAIKFPRVSSNPNNNVSSEEDILDLLPSSSNPNPYLAPAAVTEKVGISKSPILTNPNVQVAKAVQANKEEEEVFKSVPLNSKCDNQVQAALAYEEINSKPLPSPSTSTLNPKEPCVTEEEYPEIEFQLPLPALNRPKPTPEPLLHRNKSKMTFTLRGSNAYTDLLFISQKQEAELEYEASHSVPRTCNLSFMFNLVKTATKLLLPAIGFDRTGTVFYPTSASEDFSDFEGYEDTMTFDQCSGSLYQHQTYFPPTSAPAAAEEVTVPAIEEETTVVGVKLPTRLSHFVIDPVTGILDPARLSNVLGFLAGYEAGFRLIEANNISTISQYLHLNGIEQAGSTNNINTGLTEYPGLCQYCAETSRICPYQQPLRIPQQGSMRSQGHYQRKQLRQPFNNQFQKPVGFAGNANQFRAKSSESGELITIFPKTAQSHEEEEAYNADFMDTASESELDDVRKIHGPYRGNLDHYQNYNRYQAAACSNQLHCQRVNYNFRGYPNSRAQFFNAKSFTHQQYPLSAKYYYQPNPNILCLKYAPRTTQGPRPFSKGDGILHPFHQQLCFIKSKKDDRQCESYFNYFSSSGSSSDDEYNQLSVPSAVSLKSRSRRRKLKVKGMHQRSSHSHSRGSSSSSNLELSGDISSASDLET